MNGRIANFGNQLFQTVTRHRNNAKLKMQMTMGLVTDKLHLPERFKGTIVEKWIKYWQQLGMDYRDVIQGIGKTIVEQPIRSSIYGCTAFGMYCLAKTNPNEDEFWKQVCDYNTEIILVHESCHRQESGDWLKFLQQCRNEDRLRYFSLGVISVMWLDSSSNGLGLYRATCTYLRPQLLSYHERIVDVGCGNIWWNLRKKMTEFDINF